MMSNLLPEILSSVLPKYETRDALHATVSAALSQVLSKLLIGEQTT